jgi:hypothetical protein
MVAIYVPTFGFTRDSGGNDISKENFMVKMDDFFPSFGTTDKIEKSSKNGINNITDLIVSMIPMITIMTATGATLMIVW